MMSESSTKSFQAYSGVAIGVPSALSARRRGRFEGETGRQIGLIAESQARLFAERQDVSSPFHHDGDRRQVPPRVADRP